MIDKSDKFKVVMSYNELVKHIQDEYKRRERNYISDSAVRSIIAQVLHWIEE